MIEVTTYVGMDAHKKDLFLAPLIREERSPVLWHIPNDPHAVRRVVRALERDAPSARGALLRSRSVRVRVAASNDHPARPPSVISPSLIPPSQVST